MTPLSQRTKRTKQQIPLFVLALASRIRCNFQAIPAQPHAAPASRPLLAGVVEVQYAPGAFADTLAIDRREQCRRAVCQWRKQVLRFTYFEPQLRRRCASVRLQLRPHGMVREEIV